MEHRVRMRPAPTDPEAPQILDIKKLRLDQLWRKYRKTGGVEGIADATYLRSLLIMGYSPADATTELNLLKLERWR